MKAIILLALFALIVAAYSGCPYPKYYYRTNWYPPKDCVCGVVDFETSWYGCGHHGKKSECEAVCYLFFINFTYFFIN